MKFAGLVKSTLIDFPGRLACVVFTSGCPFDCFYCHNREAIDGRLSIDEKDVMAFLEKRAGQLEGVVISGGEPTMQPDIEAFCVRLKALGYAIKLDTNGWNPDTVTHLLGTGMIDYVAIDYKAPNARYHEICGCHADAVPVQETIRRVAMSGVPYELRTTKAPTLTEEDFEIMRHEIESLVAVLPFWRFNEYRKPEVFKPEDAFRIA